jgi:hypothetical protein
MMNTTETNQTTPVVLQRLESEIDWYDKKSVHNQHMFKRLKTATLAISVSIPLCALLVTWRPIVGGVITGMLGASITLLEGLQQLNQYHDNWTTYRSTAEDLKHEKFLFLSKAGAYATANNATALLAENVESRVSQEHSRWTQVQAQALAQKAQVAANTD